MTPPEGAPTLEQTVAEWLRSFVCKGFAAIDEQDCQDIAAGIIPLIRADERAKVLEEVAKWCDGQAPKEPQNTYESGLYDGLVMSGNHCRSLARPAKGGDPLADVGVPYLNED